jgi:hypothetical protein
MEVSNQLLLLTVWKHDTATTPQKSIMKILIKIRFAPRNGHPMSGALDKRLTPGRTVPWNRLRSFRVFHFKCDIGFLGTKHRIEGCRYVIVTLRGFRIEIELSGWPYPKGMPVIEIVPV